MKDTAPKRQPKEYAIIINGREKTVADKILSFIDIVKLAFGVVSVGADTIYTMTFKKGEDRKEGVLVEGDDIRIKRGMIFNVTATDKS